MVSFTSHTLPDIPAEARIIALCGVSDFGDIRNCASPTEDGWLISDFYLFNHLLRDIGASQAWFTCDEPRDLVAKYGSYVHGDPFKEHGRTIVLDQQKLDGPDAPQHVHVTEREELLDVFLDHLEEECDIARREGQPVLVLLFGHGEDKTYKFQVGWCSWTGCPQILSSDELHQRIGEGVQVCTLMTSSYSGGWSVNRDLNGSLRETCIGPTSLWNRTSSVYATAVLERLVKEEKSAWEPASTSVEPAYEMAYRGFTDAILSVLLLGTDRADSIHEIRFSAQDDAWTKRIGKRTGIPLDQFRGRYLALHTVPADILHSGAEKRDLSSARPSRTQECVKVFPYSALRGHFGSLQALQRHLRPFAKLYVGSYPGRDTRGNNIRFHMLVNRFANGHELDKQKLIELYCALDYRLSMLTASQEYLTLLGVEFPVPCDLWDEDRWLKQRTEAERAATRKTHGMLSGSFSNRRIPRGNST